MPRGATHWASGSRTRRRRGGSGPPSCCASACSGPFPRGGRAGGERLAPAAAQGALGATFVLRFGVLGAFPKGRARARVLWLGAVEGEREFAALADRVERIVGAAGFVAERRAPSAHLTLSRLGPPRPPAAP